jgi:hypothetical protein
MNTVDCSVTNLRFQNCPGWNNDYDCSYDCTTDTYMFWLNEFKPWYTDTWMNNHLGGTDANYDFMADVIYDYLCPTYTNSPYFWMPYMFCNDGGTYDDIDWVFE